MNITLKKGVHGAPLFQKYVGQKSEEFEILLKPNTIINVNGKSVYFHKNKYVVLYDIEVK